MSFARDRREAIRIGRPWPADFQEGRGGAPSRFRQVCMPVPAVSPAWQRIREPNYGHFSRPAPGPTEIAEPGVAEAVSGAAAAPASRRDGATHGAPRPNRAAGADAAWHYRTTPKVG